METGRRQKKLIRRRQTKVKALSVVGQIRDMSVRYPEFLAKRIGNEAVWYGYFRPSLACAVYLVKISALGGQRPWVTVLEPELRIPRDQWLNVHRFSHGGLCLHLHEEWTADRYIADTIVPWTAVWLINYEYWLASGSWLGEGKHPQLTPPN